MNQLNTKTTEPLVKERLALLIERETRYQLDVIIKRMQNLAKNYRIGQEGDTRSPLRNVLITATDRTASLEVIKNYIGYQTSRSDRSEKVSAILKSPYEGQKEGRRFGAALVEALDELEQDANVLLNNIESSLPETDPLREYLTPDVKLREATDLHLKLTQLYLGYLVREHTALRGSRNNNTRSEPEQKTTPDPTARFERPVKNQTSPKPNPNRR